MLYYRLARARPFFRYATLAVAAVVTLNGIVLTFLDNLPMSTHRGCVRRCRRLHGEMYGRVQITHLCRTRQRHHDIAILVLPLPMITAMHLDVREKTGLVATFITGLFATVVDVVRIAYLHELLKQDFDSENTAKPLIGNINGIGFIPNLGWYGSYSVMWSAVEVNVGLICACALVIKPLLVMIIPGTSRVGSTGQQVTIRPVPTSPRQADGLNHECPRHISGEYHDGVSTHMAHTIPPAGPHLEQFMSSTTNRHYMYPVDENREMDIRDFFNTADALVERAAPQDPRLAPQFDATIECSTPSVACSPIQEPKTFMDFVNIGDRKPLTELTKREAWWPIALGKSMRTVDNGHAR